MSGTANARAHRRRLVGLAGPVYVQLLAGVVAGIIDVLWVGRLGPDAVAAVAVATSVEAVLLGVILMAGSGTTVLVARATGAGDPAAVRAAARGGWTAFAVVTPLVAGGGWLAREPLAALVLAGADAGGGDGGGSGAVALAAAYFAVAFPGIAVFYAQQIVDGVLKGTGDTRTPMRLALLANALVLLLDPLLIFGWGGLPALGVEGAALATVAGRAVPLALGLAALRRNPVLRAARAATAPAAGSSASVSRLAALHRTAAVGLPMSADFLVRMTGSLALVAIVARLGVAEVAAYGIAVKAMYVATMGFYAVRQAAAIHTAHTLGAGRDERSAIARQAVLVSGALGLAAAVALAAAAPWVMRSTGAEGDVAAAGVLFLRSVGPYLLLLSCFIAVGGVHEGGGGAPVLAVVTLLGTAALLPAAHWLAALGLPGVALAMALSTGLQYAAVLRLFRTRRPGGRGRGMSAGGRAMTFSPPRRR